MPHMRTQIRAAVKTVLDAELPDGYVVFSSRKFARNIVPGEAIVDMRFSNDQTQAREVMSGARVHVGSLYIRVQRSLSEDALDDALDADEVLIAKAIEGASWDELLEEDPELLQTNFSDNADGGTPVGAIVIRYDVEYRIDKADPETRID